MTETPRRKRFQIHLSTAIVMMFVAGALIWANLTPRKVADTGALNRDYYGWPYGAVLKGHLSIPGDPDYYAASPYVALIFPNHIVIDYAVAFLIVIAIWYVCEHLLRRRAAKKGA